jgi:hypothetical protein
MEQDGSRTIGHAPVSICSSRSNSLEKSQHASHALCRIYGFDKVQLGGTWVGKTDGNAMGRQCGHKKLSTIHIDYPTGYYLG